MGGMGYCCRIGSITPHFTATPSRSTSQTFLTDRVPFLLRPIRASTAPVLPRSPSVVSEFARRSPACRPLRHERTQFANVFIEIDNRRADSDTLTPSVIASFTASSRNSFVYSLGDSIHQCLHSSILRNVCVHFFQPTSPWSKGGKSGLPRS